MEYYYTFLTPIIFEHDGINYLCWGYREIDGKIDGFSATQTCEQLWTSPIYFTDPTLVEKFKKNLPEKPIKKRKNK